MICLRSFLTFLIFLAAGQMPSTTDWRGLSPLKSTRMDVERTLGPPSKNMDNQKLIYYYPDVVVSIDFSSNPKCREKLPYTSWDVSSDTVTSIYVILRHAQSVEETGIDLTKLKKSKGDYDLFDHYYYTIPDDGFSIEVDNNLVKGYLYGPGSNQVQLRCPPQRQVR